AHSVRFLTAHSANRPDLDWKSLAQPGQTLVFYMGVSQIVDLQSQLLKRGRAPDTPFALIVNGTRSQQRVLTGRLSELASLATYHSCVSPLLLVMIEDTTHGSNTHHTSPPHCDTGSVTHKTIQKTLHEILRQTSPLKTILQHRHKL